MALIHHHIKKANGEFERVECGYYSSPAEFVINKIPDGVPFRCYKNGIDIREDIEAMLQDGEFTIVEGSGNAVLNPFSSFNDPLGINRKIRDAILPQPEEVNRQAASANNSLTDRNNKPRPYARAYDVCGTVQSIPSDLMQTYNVYDSTNRQFQYGYYYIGRDYLDTPNDGVTDGDTILSTITGSSANIYDPFTSPNNSAPRQIIGELITEPLFITQRSQNVDGGELKAPNEYVLGLKGDGIAVSCQLSGVIGALVEASGTLRFDDLFKVGQSVTLENVKSALAVLNGTYTISAISGTSISFDVTTKLTEWSKIVGGNAPMDANDAAKVSPTNLAEAGFTDWVTISAIKPQRIVANIIARQGMFRAPSGDSATFSSSSTAELQWQLVESGTPVGAINPVFKTLTDNRREEVGMSIIVEMPFRSAVRVRVRRSTNLDKDYDGTVVDALTFNDLYGQIQDSTPNYGNLTTIHTRRRNTAQATSVKSPQLKVIATEMLFKYLGNGVFDTVRTANTQAVQSLIRLARDPVVGNLVMSNKSMDDLLAVQTDIETYFGDVQAGQFCYTFDDEKTTFQGIAQTIALAVFSTVFRKGNDIKLHFEKPIQGPAMLFTHRSKTNVDKWTRSFGSVQYDSVEFTWIDPETNIRETIRIPENGGIDPNKIESKGVRNYQQAFWLANRARQRDLLQRVTCEFTATEEGRFVIEGEAIGVVKNSRIAAYDGYIVAQNGFTLTLSQEVAFTAGDDHYIKLKRRDGTVESVRVLAGSNARTVIMQSLPSEAIYTGNSAVKTEFSFGNEARHLAQLIIPTTIGAPIDRTVKITGRNYHPDIYLYDGIPATGNAFDSGFDDGFA